MEAGGPSATTIGVIEANQLEPVVTHPTTEQILKPENKTESKPQFEEAENLVQGFLINRAKDYTIATQKKEPTTPEWSKNVDPKALNTLTYLHGIRNLPEGVLKQPQDIQAPENKNDMYVLYNPINDKEGEYELLFDDREPADGQTKLRITSLLSRSGDTLSFQTDYSQHRVYLTIGQFDTLFIHAQKDKLVPLFDEKAQQVAQDYLDNITTPAQFSTDTDTFTEAVKNSGRISTDSLIQSLPDADTRTSPLKEEQDAINARNQKRAELINKLKTHAIATPQDMAEVMSFHTPVEIQKTIASYDKEINGRLDSLQRLRSLKQIAAENNDSAQVDSLQKEISVIQSEITDFHNKIKDQKEALTYFEDPKQLVEFFSMVETGEISPEVGKHINELLQNKQIPEALGEMAQAKFDALDDETKEMIKEKLGLSHTQELILNVASGTLVMIVMLMMEGMKQK